MPRSTSGMPESIWFESISSVFLRLVWTLMWSGSSYRASSAFLGLMHTTWHNSKVGTGHHTLLYLFHLLIPYRPSHFLGPSSSSNLLKFPSTIYNTLLDSVGLSKTFNSFSGWHLTKGPFLSRFQYPTVANSREHLRFTCVNDGAKIQMFSWPVVSAL